MGSAELGSIELGSAELGSTELGSGYIRINARSRSFSADMFIDYAGVLEKFSFCRIYPKIMQESEQNWLESLDSSHV